MFWTCQRTPLVKRIDPILPEKAQLDILSARPIREPIREVHKALIQKALSVLGAQYDNACYMCLHTKHK